MSNTASLIGVFPAVQKPFIPWTLTLAYCLLAALPEPPATTGDLLGTLAAGCELGGEADPDLVGVS